MEIFSYEDYIKSIHTLRLNSVFQLAEEKEKYKLELEKQKTDINYIYEKLVKIIFKDKKEVESFINKYVNTKEKISNNNLEEYKSNFVNSRFKSRKKDIIYKMEEKNMFFLIRYQNKINNSVIYEILNTCVDIIYSWNVLEKSVSKTNYPVVVPIIIYTGKEKCNITYDLSDMQISDYIFKNYKINFKYNLIETNEITKKALIRDNTLFSYIMALQKTKNYEEFKNIISEILIENKNKKRNQEKLCYILNLLIENLSEYNLNKKQVEEIKNEINKYSI